MFENTTSEMGKNFEKKARQGFSHAQDMNVSSCPRQCEIAGTLLTAERQASLADVIPTCSALFNIVLTPELMWRHTFVPARQNRHAREQDSTFCCTTTISKKPFWTYKMWDTDCVPSSSNWEVHIIHSLPQWPYSKSVLRAATSRTHPPETPTSTPLERDQNIVQWC